MMQVIDIDSLRKDLIDYFGTAMATASPLAMIELSKIESSSDEELIQIAQNNCIDLNQYLYTRNKEKENIYVRK